MGIFHLSPLISFSCYPRVILALWMVYSILEQILYQIKLLLFQQYHSFCLFWRTMKLNRLRKSKWRLHRSVLWFFQQIQKIWSFCSCTHVGMVDNQIINFLSCYGLDGLSRLMFLKFYCNILALTIIITCVRPIEITEITFILCSRRCYPCDEWHFPFQQKSTIALISKWIAHPVA